MIKGLEARISLTPGATPIFHRPRPVPNALQTKVEEELDRLVAEDILRPLQKSEWAAPIVVVKKGDGGIRICGDYKTTINRHIDYSSYPMPNPQDLFATLSGGRKFTRLDMRHAYLQLKVAPESQPSLFGYKHQQRLVHLYQNAIWH